MYSTLINDDLDVVIGSRYMEKGSTGGLPSHRVFISKVATKVSQILIGSSVTDPMSGFFILKRSYFEQVMRSLHGKGFKILLDLLVSPHGKPRLKEVPYTMRERLRGTSKLGATVIWEFFTLILSKLFGKYIPSRFLSFAAVGLSGVAVHLGVLGLLYKYLELDFFFAQGSAIIVAMTSNFLLNNFFTFRDKILLGKELIYGLFSFYLACLLGAGINFAVASILFNDAFPWWLAGFTGAVAGAVWNYATTSTFTWSK